MALTPHKAGALMSAAIGAVHLVLSGEYLSETPYIGVLFIVGGLALVAAAAMLWPRRTGTGRQVRLGWAIAVTVSGGMFVGGILSRTVGLPGFYEPEWELSLIASLLMEAGVMTLWVRQLGTRPHTAASPAHAPGRQDQLAQRD